MQKQAPSIRTVAAASFVRTAIEWCDFFAYGTAAALVFGPVFFPNSEPLVGALLSFLTFAIGFLAPPLGAVIFGHFGDRIGARFALVFTLVGMGAATFLVGVVPSYASIGVAIATWLLDRFDSMVPIAALAVVVSGLVATACFALPARENVGRRKALATAGAP